MKKILTAIAAVSTAAVAFAWGPGRGPCPGWGAPPPPPCHSCGWGRGGCDFWPALVGGAVGGAIVTSVISRPAPAPVIVQQPVVVQPVVVQQPAVVPQAAVRQPVTQTQNVWVEGRYVDQVQADGKVVRTWQPGHYEQRTVVIQ